MNGLQSTSASLTESPRLEESAQPAVVFKVPSPFDSESPGDCVLRTPDGTKFKVVRIILVLGSAFFRDMFGLPQPLSSSPGESDVENLPIVDVSEDAETIHTLLDMLYPVKPPAITSYNLAVKMIIACDKYLIDVANLQPHLHDLLASESALNQDPLGVYAIAWRLGMEEEAKKASRYTHTADLSDGSTVRSLIHRSGSLDCLLALVKLRTKREEALGEVLKASRLSEGFCGGHNYAWLDIVSSLKTQVQSQLQRPYPACVNFVEFFDIKRHTCGSCPSTRANFSAWTDITAVNKTLDAYPQTIFGYVFQDYTSLEDFLHPNLMGNSQYHLKMRHIGVAMSKTRTTINIIRVYFEANVIACEIRKEQTTLSTVQYYKNLYAGLGFS